MKVSELKGGDLDYWVAKAEGFQRPPPANPYSISWDHTGPLIQKHEIKVECGASWEAVCQGKEAKGRTALEAICRAVVMAKFGDEVPDPVE